MIFKNLKEAHIYYKYPSSHRFGTIGDENGVIRSYSNGINCDKILFNGKVIYYKVKNDKVKNLYRISIDTKKKVRFFSKIKEGVLDMGMYLPVRFYNGFVKLVKSKE